MFVCVAAMQTIHRDPENTNIHTTVLGFTLTHTNTGTHVYEYTQTQDWSGASIAGAGTNWVV